MLFTWRETFWGLRHLALRFSRRLLGKPADAFIKRYAGTGAEPVQDQNGSVQECLICGFTLISLEMEEGWRMEMCSALPVLDIGSADFKQWAHSLSEPDRKSGGGANTHQDAATPLPGSRT